MLIIDLLLQHNRDRPNSTAILDGDCSITYSELLSQVLETSKALISKGISPGDRIATIAPPCLGYWVIFLATTTIGAEWVGLNPRYQRREYKFFIEDACPKMIFTFSPYDGRDYQKELEVILTDTDTVEQPEVLVFSNTNFNQSLFGLFMKREDESVAHQTLESRIQAVGEHNTAAIVYTSGSTGKPKGTMLSHYALLKCAEANVKWLGDSLEKVIAPYPINHVGNLNNICMNVLTFGGTIYFLKTFSITDIIELYKSSGITHAGHNQTTFQMLLDSPNFTREAISAIKTLVHGGSKTNIATLEVFQKTNINIASVYAQTESCGYVLRSDFNAPLETMANTIGKPIDGVKARIFHNERGAIAEEGEFGELQLKFDWVFSGYLNNPDATSAAFTLDGYLRTGDLCVRRPDGNYELIERIKNVFKSGGYDIYPAEIEQVLHEHPKVRLAVIIEVNHQKFGSCGYAFVQQVSGVDLQESELISYLRKEISGYKIPKHIDRVDDLPLLPSKKIDRQSLKNLAKVVPK
jgi:acyl-CoA synthetase (AMP-forming)/AMP-acid ligase II